MNNLFYISAYKDKQLKKGSSSSTRKTKKKKAKNYGKVSAHCHFLRAALAVLAPFLTREASAGLSLNGY